MGWMHQMHVFTRLIERRGQNVGVYRERTNEFHEPEECGYVCDVCGLFHEANGYLGISLAEAGKVHTAKQPMLLIPYTDHVQKQDIVRIDDRIFRVTGVDDLGNLHLFLDLSLEVV